MMLQKEKEAELGLCEIWVSAARGRDKIIVDDAIAKAEASQGRRNEQHSIAPCLCSQGWDEIGWNGKQ